MIGMTLHEINQEIKSIEKIDGKLLTRENIERLIFLLKERSKMSTAVFHYDQNLSIAEIQLAAKVIFAQLEETPYRDNLENLICPAPLELNGDWSNFKNKKINYDVSKFIIKTHNYGECLYFLDKPSQLLGLESSLFLDAAQNTLKRIYTGDTNFDITDADVLTNSFILINSSITQFFLNIVQESETFSWDIKYSPCFFDRKRILDFRGWMMLDDFKKIVNPERLNLGKTYLMRDFAMQTKFLTFWVGLMDTLTFPNLKKPYREVYINLIAFLLKRYANIYIYDIVTESNLVKDSGNSANRGSNSNTTRLKIFYTTGDDVPRLIRLDLPHEDHPYVHLNIHKYGSDENIHFRISSNENFSGEYDGVFDSLIEVLRVYNFFTISTRHSPVSDDKMVFKEMEYWTAMYNLAIPAMGEILIGENKELDAFDVVKEAREKLISLLEEDGISKDESGRLNNHNLFELADGLIRGNSIIP